MTKIKICGLFRPCDIDFVNEAKPDYIGFILNFPKSHRNLTVEQAAGLKQHLAADIKAVGVFVDQVPETVLTAAEVIGLDVIQLHGHESSAYITDLKGKTALPVWKAFKIRSTDDLADAEDSPADDVILDNGYGTGTVFNWSYAASFSRPFILAGGLTPENIPEAIETLQPKLLDISSGVETDKVKDREKIFAAVRAARKVTAAKGG